MPIFTSSAFSINVLFAQNFEFEANVGGSQAHTRLFSHFFQPNKRQHHLVVSCLLTTSQRQNITVTILPIVPLPEDFTVEPQDLRQRFTCAIGETAEDHTWTCQPAAAPEEEVNTAKKKRTPAPEKNKKPSAKKQVSLSKKNPSESTAMPTADVESFEVIMDGEEVVVTDEQDEEDEPRNDNAESERLPDTALIDTAESNSACDSDDEDSIDEEELTWRGDPSKTLSDWTLQVSILGSTSVKTYHVHKSVLAVGPRRSGYFSRSFSRTGGSQRQPAGGRSPRSALDMAAAQDSGEQMESFSVVANLVDFVDHKNCLSRIELHRLAADAVPVLLDFMYSSTGKLAITTENATPLHSLSTCLEMKHLRRKVREFWNSDLNMENLTTYYAHGRVFKDTRILAHAEDYCARHIFEVREQAVVEILTAVDPFFFLRVVTLSHELQKDDEQAPLRLSLLIAVYGNIHKSELTPSLFLRLTAPAHLPTVEVKAARVLLELEDDICGNSDGMTSMKERAIAVLSKNWDEACFVPKPDLPSNGSSNSSELVGKPPKPPSSSGRGNPSDEVVSLPRVTGKALESFCSRSLMRAKQKLHDNSAELSALRKFKAERQSEVDVEDKLKAELAAALQEVRALKQENEKLQKDTQAEIELMKQTTKADMDRVKQSAKQEVDHMKQTSVGELESLREQRLKLQTEVNDLRKEQAIHKDLLKLRRVADTGPSGFLRSGSKQ